MIGQNFIVAEEFLERRQRLMAQCTATDILILPAASQTIRNRDSEYPFRQHSSFWYLTGFHEPDALLVLLPDGQGSGISVLFCLERDREKEIWTGYRVGPEGAVSRFGMDKAYVLDQRDGELPELLKGRKQVYLPLSDQGLLADLQRWNASLGSRERSQLNIPQQVQNISPLIDEMRLIKSEAECQQMRAAGELSAQGHVLAMQTCKPGMTEYQLEATILKCFADQGARYPAYTTIVGGGANGCILHYTENQDELRAGDLVLIDAGAELGHYAGDITRTFPVSGRFSEPQRKLYEIVLEAQRVAIDAIAPGNSWNLGHERALEVLTRGLLELGILEGDVDELLQKEAYRPYYMHRTGHWLGLDVHDVGEYKADGNWRPLQPGMVLTVEPGLYIAPDAEEVDAQWRGIGIRIEDDVLVTKDGHEVLSAGVPKSVDEIEALMSGAA